MQPKRALVIAAVLATACGSRTGLAVDPASEPSCNDAGVCAVCDPGERRCDAGDVWMCRDDGSGWDLAEPCAIEDGLTCRDARCVTLCEDARAEPSYLGCEFWSADLDNASLGYRDVTLLDYGITIGNPWPVPVRVVVERNDAPPGAPPQIVEVDARTIPPRDHERIALPQREIDRTDPDVPTHSALTSNAYRVTSTLPVTIVQANPLESIGYSRDTSLLLPTEMLGERTTVIGWPETIADGDTPENDFSPTMVDEDDRAFLTIVGTHPDTRVRVRLGDLGPPPAEVVAGGPIPRLGSGELFETTLGAFDVLNLETRGLNADFTGTVVESDAPVAVFVGSEASDVPRFDTYANRQCCGDHLEEQLWPDRYAGTHFVVGRQYSRRAALARAGGTHIIDLPEPEWVRIVAVEDATLEARPPTAGVPSALAATDDVIVRVDASFEIAASSGRLHVMSALASQNVIGVAPWLPGGDPSLVLVPPTESLTRSAEIVVPDGSSFDFVTIFAPRGASVLLDGMPLAMWLGPEGGAACEDETTPAFDVHRCALAFPTIDASTMSIDDGAQDDGLHTVIADRPIGVTVSGFQSYISYGHPGAMYGF